MEKYAPIKCFKSVESDKKMQPFCQNPQLSRSLESELESAVKSGELKLQSKNLKDFPKHGDRYNLQDTTLAGEENVTFFQISYHHV